MLFINTDGEKDIDLKKIIEKWWKVQKKSKPEPKIFWCFIVDERNSILKEYKFGAGININVHVDFNAAQLEPGKPKELLSDRPTEYDYVMNKGPFKGIDQRDLITQAIE